MVIKNPAPGVDCRVDLILLKPLQGSGNIRGGRERGSSKAPQSWVYVLQRLCVQGLAGRTLCRTCLAKGVCPDNAQLQDVCAGTEGVGTRQGQLNAQVVFVAG